mmetsp:Transcript_59286/g.190751  ORF Transcript_59286/g.190751 Transcript_59286/m.190751 type:complete len:215 (-) Transcript_59286:42-686(-)
MWGELRASSGTSCCWTRICWHTQRPCERNARWCSRSSWCSKRSWRRGSQGRRWLWPAAHLPAARAAATPQSGRSRWGRHSARRRLVPCRLPASRSLQAALATPVRGPRSHTWSIGTGSCATGPAGATSQSMQPCASRRRSGHSWCCDASGRAPSSQLWRQNMLGLLAPSSTLSAFLRPSSCAMSSRTASGALSQNERAACTRPRCTAPLGQSRM